MLKLTKLLRPFAGELFLAIVFLFAQAFCELNLPNYMAEMVNVGVRQQRYDYIARSGLTMLGIALLGGLAVVLVSLLSSRIAAGFSRDLRSAAFSKIEGFSNGEFDAFSSASLITRCTNDVTQVQTLVTMGIRLVCYAPVMGIGGIIMAVRHSSSMGWIIALACIVLVGLIMVVMKVAVPKFTIVQKLIDKLNLVSRENLSGMMVIRAFGTQEYEKQRFEQANDDLTRTNLFIGRTMALMMPVMTLIMNGTSLLIIGVSARQIAASTMQIGDMMAFMQYAIQIIMAFLMISMMFIWVPRAAVSAKRIAEVLESRNSIVDPLQPQSFDKEKRGVVEFKEMSFRYKGAAEDALHEISFTALPGQTTAIIGATGAGKTTLVNALMRFYDVSSGSVLVGGVDVRDVLQRDLRSLIAYCPQKSSLFSGTIASNIRYGKKDATDDEVERAAATAQALEFIDEKRFEREIAQAGANVSGGQKQRLAIARALLKQSEIIIFDDSFSALDFKTDSLLRQALKQYAKNSTLIIIAQRISTIMQAENIIVLDRGRIAGAGTHQSLLKTCPEYAEIASLQLAQEEVV